MEQSAKNGEPVNREEAIRLLEIHLPEIRQYVTAENEDVNYVTTIVLMYCSV